MGYVDLRTWLDKVNEINELKHLSGMDPNLEIGALAELLGQKEGSPSVLLDDIKGYPKGYRLLLNAEGTLNRLALGLGMPGNYTVEEFVKVIKEKMRTLKPLPCNEVSDGPIYENVLARDRIDMNRFPAPKWNEGDGGRYIGTGCMVITEDPDEGWVNAGTYRVMVHDRDTLGLRISPSKHGKNHIDKAFKRGESPKIAVTFGQDFSTYFAACNEVAYGVSEFEYAGGLVGEPINVIKGPYSGLPIPADAEIAVEGYIPKDEQRMEGPFGEWTGYYGDDARMAPIIKVKNVLHRNNPIICGRPELKPTWCSNLARAVVRSAILWNELESMGIPGITGVWCHPVGFRLLNLVSVKTMFHGHSKHVGMLATQCRTAHYLGRYTIVVDDDIDIYNDQNYLWALLTRSDPASSIEILRDCVSGPLDPRISKQDKKNNLFYNSRAIIDACRPYHWKDEFPKPIGFSKERLNEVMKKLG